uniref:Uncharacterized protein n=1 Tax=Panagrolaimus sp. PS1159 TaxID=55785 RepID=A0AC35FC33_9BILA
MRFLIIFVFVAFIISTAFGLLFNSNVELNGFPNSHHLEKRQDPLFRRVKPTETSSPKPKALTQPKLQQN